MKKLFIALTAISALSLAAIDHPCNGGFEKCKADRNGTLMPEVWGVNKSQTKKATMQVTNEADAPRSGKFAFDFEVEKGGQAFITCWAGLKVNPGDKIKISAYAKGSGTFQLAYILYGTPEGGKDSFLWTASLGKFKPTEDKYQQFAKEFTFKQPVKNGKKCSAVTLFPVLIIGSDSTMLLDDYAVNVKPAAPAKK